MPVIVVTHDSGGTSAQDKLAADPVFATLLARVAGWAELTERFLIAWTDI